jgi:hypothetical protein
MFPVTDHLSPIEQQSACNALSPKSKCTLHIFLIVYIVGSCVVLSLSRSLSRFNSSLWPELRISVGCECSMYKRAKFAGVMSVQGIQEEWFYLPGRDGIKSHKTAPYRIQAKV